MEDENWVIDMEISLVKTFGWSLHEIDETDIETLIPFMLRFAGMNGEPVVSKKAYCDEVSWL